MSTVALANLVRPNVKSLKGYQVEISTHAIQLHANENPFPPSKKLMSLFQECLKEIKLNRYPDPECKGLKQALAQKTGSPLESIAIGNGSDELIQLILQIFCESGDRVVFPDPAFGMYSIIAKGMGLNPQPYSLDEHCDFKADQILAFISKSQAKVIFFGYPNNPTGNCFSASEIQKVIKFHDFH